MSVGTYGTIRPADVLIEDIDVFYTYAPNRETRSQSFFRINSNEVLSYNYLPDDEQIENNENLLEGIYNMKLPATIFNQIGIYTIYLRPKVEITTIVDCSVLSSLPTIKGIVLDSNALPERLRANNAMQGYKIEYVDNNGNKIRNVTRYVVSSNKVVPVTQNISTSNDTATRYRFDDSGSLIFLQLTPSNSSDVKPNQKPFIGEVNQTIHISNTNFNPLSVEVEMVENDIDTVVNIVGGEVVKDVDNGILTYYNSDREIIKQFDVYEIKNENNRSLYEVKELRENIDENQDFDNVTTGLE